MITKYFLMAVLSFFSYAISLAAGSLDTAQTYQIALAGNAFDSAYQGGRSAINKEGAKLQPNASIDVYFKVNQAGKLTLSLNGFAQGNQSAQLRVNYGTSQKVITISGSAEKGYDLGTFDIPNAGYQKVHITALAGGEALLSRLSVSGTATDQGIIYASQPDFHYWSRRGPSCHLGYQLLPNQEVSYFYNEMQVPEGQDIIGSYFMAVGFGEGYFGIQVNGSDERRVLFSVWSPFHTDDPKAIPESERIVLLKKGTGVHTGEFGNEGSGGQSYWRYAWKAKETYKFLLKGLPDGAGNTDFTAWFYVPEDAAWKLIASFKRPKTDHHLTRFHSFLENFNPNYGAYGRKVHFSNPWYHTAQGWQAVQQARFTVDNTYHKKQRVDAIGGVEGDAFFLQNGGFNDAYVAPNTPFTKPSTGTMPAVDFLKLP